MKVILIMAITVDGKIGKSRDHFPDWTGTEDKRLFAKLSKEAGVVIMGSRTFDTIAKPLPQRKNVILTRNKSRRSEWENLIFTDKPPAAILADLEAEGFTQAVLAGGTGVNSLFAQAKLIDEMIVTVSPKIFGNGLSLFSGDIAMDLELQEVERLGRDLVYLRYKVRK